MMEYLLLDFAALATDMLYHLLTSSLPQIYHSSRYWRGGEVVIGEVTGW